MIMPAPTVASNGVKRQTIPRTNGNRRQNVRCKVTCNGPNPAWPGRAPVPDSLPKRDGPKVRRVQLKELYMMHFDN